MTGHRHRWIPPPPGGSLRYTCGDCKIVIESAENEDEEKRRNRRSGVANTKRDVRCDPSAAQATKEEILEHLQTCALHYAWILYGGPRTDATKRKQAEESLFKAARDLYDYLGRKPL